MKAFSKKLLIADYIVALLLIAGFFICVALNGAYTREVYNIIISNGIDISYSSIPQLYPLDGFGILLGSWIIQLGMSSGAYYLMSRSDHKIQLPMKMLDTMPDEIKKNIDLTQVITTILSTTDN